MRIIRGRECGTEQTPVFLNMPEQMQALVQVVTLLPAAPWSTSFNGEDYGAEGAEARSIDTIAFV